MLLICANTPVIFDKCGETYYILSLETEVFEVQNPEDMTDEWLKEKLQFFVCGVS